MRNRIQGFDRNKIGLAALALLLIAAAGRGALGKPGGRQPLPPLPPEPTPEWQPFRFENGSISLLEAVRLTLAHSPELRLRQEDTRFFRGVLQGETGRFDSTLLGDFAFEYVRQELRASRKTAQREVRDDLRDGIDELTEELDTTERIIEEIDRLQGDPTGVRVSDPDLQSTIDILNTFIEEADTPAERAQRIQRRDRIIAEARGEYVEEADELRDELADSTRRLADLGPAPEEEELYDGRLHLEYLYPFRTGLTVGTFFEYTLQGDRFVDKPADSERGGKGIDDLYRGTVGFTADLPLARGWGAASTGAPERAAGIEYEASLATLRHTASTAVLETVLAYWDAVAAAESVEVFEESLRVQSRLVELTEALIEADELPLAELTRVQAREASVRAAVEDARRSAHEARLALAAVIGLEVEDEAAAPRPADGFPGAAPEELAAVEEAGLLDRALESREDYRAARRLEEAGAVLARAARLDLKPRLDLGGRLWYNALSEGSGSGALTGSWVGPSYNFGLELEWPFANNVQEGRLLQFQADHGSRSVSARDLARLIRIGVVQTLGSLREASEQLRSSRAAVESYRRLVEAEVERFGLKASTLIDTLLTEQRLTEAQLVRVLAHRGYAALVAQLRFETGTMVTPSAGGGEVSEASLLRVPGAAGTPEG